MHSAASGRFYPLDMSTDGAGMIASIVRDTGLRMNTWRVLEHGASNVIVEVNGEWVFRFPRPGSPRDNAQERLRFLGSFSRVSPLAVPEPVYVTEGNDTGDQTNEKGFEQQALSSSPDSRRSGSTARANILGG